MQRNFSILTILLSFFFAIIFWGYVSLNASYTTFTNFSLRVVLPRDRALANELPASVFIKVRGTGWKLVNLLYSPWSQVEAVVDVSHIDPQIRDTYILSKRDILAGLRTPVNVDILDVTPDNIRFSTDVIAIKTVPVEPRVNVQYRTGFIPTGPLQINPDSIEIRGSQRALASINQWPTQAVTVQDAFRSFTLKVAIADSLKNFVTPSKQSVVVRGQVQQMAELEIPDIPIEILNAPAGSNHYLRPNKISAVVRGGVYDLEKFTHSDIRAVVDYYTLVADTLGIIRPRLIYPGKINAISTSPQFVRHLINVPERTLAETKQ